MTVHPHVRRVASREIAIVGGGPAGLRAAEVAAAAGAAVTLYDAKASVGRKFLVAGKGGLNLTHHEALDAFALRYSAGPWREILREFGPDDLRAWAADLGVDTFVASSGRVYPKELKAAPLLRRWVQRLKSQGVRFAMHHRWLRLQRRDRLQLVFASAAEVATREADAVILALGGASWPETGSDGAWVPVMREMGVAVADLQPANCGWEVEWASEAVRECEGVPLKNIAVQAAGRRCS